ncbi:hypothetical protein [Bacillus paranthracis]|uniref:hypothetical protein n=1 Tax=Bacillus paranthracis TaxID=2026186 RepID=UPI0013D453C6|nr:hypothetical protein [Bacillus paranthracis]
MNSSLVFLIGCSIILISCIACILGFIKPGIVLWWKNENNLSKRQVSQIYIPILIAGITITILGVETSIRTNKLQILFLVYSILLVLISIVSLFITPLIFKKGKKSKIKQFAFLLTVSIGCFIISVVAAPKLTESQKQQLALADAKEAKEKEIIEKRETAEKEAKIEDEKKAEKLKKEEKEKEKAEKVEKEREKEKKSREEKIEKDNNEKIKQDENKNIKIENEEKQKKEENKSNEDVQDSKGIIGDKLSVFHHLYGNGTEFKSNGNFVEYPIENYTAELTLSVGLKLKLSDKDTIFNAPVVDISIGSTHQIYNGKSNEELLELAKKYIPNDSEFKQSQKYEKGIIYTFFSKKFGNTIDPVYFTKFDFNEKDPKLKKQIRKGYFEITILNEIPLSERNIDPGKANRILITPGTTKL